MKLLPKRKNLYKVFALCGLFLMFACAETGSVDVTEEIIEANVEFIDAFNANDAARLSMVYTEDATIYPPNSDAITGRKAIEDYWKAGFEAGVNNGSLTTDKAMARGNVAVETGKFEIFTADGDPIDKGKYMVVWKKVDGAWKYYKDIWNSSMPPPEPEPEVDPNATLTDMSESSE